MPAVVGGGLGDIEEVLAAGRRLANAGYPVYLYRAPGRAWPRSVEGPWDWPPLRRVRRPVRLHPSAMTISPAWGVSAQPSRPEPYGRGGPWAVEAAAVERAYGPKHTLHVSLEEFARTLTLRRETRERFREGGVAARELADRIRGEPDETARQFRTAFSTFRAFDRPNVLHLFATLHPDRSFGREFPPAVQTGPLWPRRPGPRGHRTRGPRRWVWYASPASAEAIAPAVVRGLADAVPSVRLLVRAARPWTVALPPRSVEVRPGPMPAATWTRRFRAAELRIVTGSRTLLEALELGGPFLYFNGVLGVGRRRRRHRPEKIAVLLDALRAARAPADLRRDLADFARARRIEEIVRRAASGTGGWARFPHPLPVQGFPPGFEDAGAVVLRAAHALARPPHDAPGVVAALRAASKEY